MASPTFDTIDPDLLFNELLIPPADIDGFVPRDPMHQFVVPWSKQEQEHFAPRISRESVRKKRSKIGHAPDVVIRRWIDQGCPGLTDATAKETKSDCSSEQQDASDPPATNT